MKSLVWLYQSTVSKETHALALGIDALGFKSFWVNTRESEWTKKITPEAFAILVIAADPRKIQNSVIEWKAQDVQKSNVPSLWIHEPLDLTSLRWLSALDFDDFFEIRGNSAELAIRLDLRAKHCIEKAKYAKSALAHSLDLAKTETIVKQREEFLSVCAHDLRSPLGLIQTSLTMLLKGDLKLNSFQTELIERAKRQATQAVGLVNDLLDVMAYEQGLRPTFQLLELDAFLSEFYRDYSLQAQQKNITFHYQNQVPRWQVLADEDRLRQLLQNLFTNAVKFTEPGKNIFLSVASFHGRRRTDPAYPMLILSVKDEGKGIPQNEQAKIFDRFTQVKSNARADGRGLGLTVAKQISALHDGNLWVQSEEGKGSTFNVLLPHVVSDGKQSETKKKIILASHDASAEISAQLNEWGYEVISARDGVEAVTLTFFNNPAAVLLGNQLPKLCEDEVATILKTDPRIQNSKILKLNETGAIIEATQAKKIFDGVLSLPLKRQALDGILGKAKQVA